MVMQQLTTVEGIERWWKAWEDKNMSGEDNDIFLSREQIVEMVRSELGIPIARSTIDKAAMMGTGPQPAAKFGKKFLYRKSDAIAWARALLSPVDEPHGDERKVVRIAMGRREI